MTSKKTKDPKAEEGSKETENLDELRQKANEEAKKELESNKGEKETPSPESVPGKQTESDEVETETESEAGDKDEPKASKTQEDSEDSSDDVINNLSEKAQRRYRKLSGENSELTKQLEEERKKREELEKKLSKPDTTVQVPKLKLSEPGNLPWAQNGQQQDQGQGNQNLTPEQVAGITQKQIEYQKQVDQFGADVQDAVKKYPVLNSESEHYNETLEKKLSEYYRATAMEPVQVRTENGVETGYRFRPDAPRFSDFADEFMTLRNSAKEEGKSAGVKTLRKKAAEQPVVSSGSSGASEGNAEDKIRDPKTSLEDARAIANRASR